MWLSESANHEFASRIVLNMDEYSQANENAKQTNLLLAISIGVCRPVVDLGVKSLPGNWISHV